MKCRGSQVPTHHLRLRPDGDLLLRGRVRDGDDYGSQGVPDHVQQRLALLSVEDLYEGATGSLPDVDGVLLHRAGADVLPVPRETTLAPVTPAQHTGKEMTKNHQAEQPTDGLEHVD